MRSYRDREVDRKVVRTLLEAAVRAPTAVHEEVWAFVVVQDRQLLHRLSERAKPLFLEELEKAGGERAAHAFDIYASPDFSLFHDAGTLIVICGKDVGPFVAADCWLAAENLMLAAAGMGLGSCVIGAAVAALKLAEVKAQLGIPADYSAIAPIVVGYPSGETAASSRREPLVLAWHRAPPGTDEGGGAEVPGY